MKSIPLSSSVSLAAVTGKGWFFFFPNPGAGQKAAMSPFAAECQETLRELAAEGTIQTDRLLCPATVY